MQLSTISMIAAIGYGKDKNRAIGKGNQLLWHIPADLKRFREITKGHPCIMGRKTFDSIIAILGKPLPHRTNIVITRDAAWTHEGVLQVSSIEEAIQLAKRMGGGEEVFIIGGAEIYALGISYADKLYLTLIDDEKEGDAFFPPFEGIFKGIVYEEEHTHEGIPYRWLDVTR